MSGVFAEVWSCECEKLLSEWSEKASCYRWLHGRSEKKYRRRYYAFSIPVIILSTLSGAANVGMDSFISEESKSTASAIVGGVNIFAGILGTLQNFLKICRSEYDRLIEQSPMIDDDIIGQFRSKFKAYEVSKPAICNGLDKCIIYRSPSCPDESKKKDMEDMDLEYPEDDTVSAPNP